MHKLSRLGKGWLSKAGNAGLMQCSVMRHLYSLKTGASPARGEESEFHIAPSQNPNPDFLLFQAVSLQMTDVQADFLA